LYSENSYALLISNFSYTLGINKLARKYKGKIYNEKLGIFKYKKLYSSLILDLSLHTGVNNIILPKRKVELGGTYNIHVNSLSLTVANAQYEKTDINNFKGTLLHYLKSNKLEYIGFYTYHSKGLVTSNSFKINTLLKYGNFKLIPHLASGQELIDEKQNSLFKSKGLKINYKGAYISHSHTEYLNSNLISNKSLDLGHTWIF
jgi:hypothetical protein